MADLGLTQGQQQVFHSLKGVLTVLNNFAGRKTTLLSLLALYHQAGADTTKVGLPTFGLLRHDIWRVVRLILFNNYSRK